MSQQNSIDPVIVEKLEKLVYDEVRFGILITLRFYGSLNLKKIAQLIGKPETTTIRHLKQLLEEGLIDIDAEKTASSWGKFYCMTKAVKAIVEKEDAELQKREQEIAKELADYKNMTEDKLQEVFIREITSKESLEETALRIKYSINFSANVQNMIINSFIEASKKINKLKEEKGVEYIRKNLFLDPADVNTTTLFIKYSKAKHVMALVEKFVDFHREFHQLQRDILKEMDEENVPEDKRKIHLVDLFMGTTEFTYKIKDE
ncbi:MAG: helix-turn-helix transcriptional regulator [Asgard group archaeon]|nr:helix-turn-helix transcriptional regulator [Asgard group archaeon]